MLFANERMKLTKLSRIQIVRVSFWAGRCWIDVKFDQFALVAISNIRRFDNRRCLQVRHFAMIRGQHRGRFRVSLAFHIVRVGRSAPIDKHDVIVRGDEMYVRTRIGSGCIQNSKATGVTSVGHGSNDRQIARGVRLNAAGAQEASVGHLQQKRVVRIKTVQPDRQEVPRAQMVWKQWRSMPLRTIDCDDGQRKYDKDDKHQSKQRSGEQTEQKDEQRKQQKHEEQVEYCEPTVSSGCSTQGASQFDRKSHVRNWIEQKYAGHIEQQVTQGQLHAVVQGAGVGRGRGQQPGGCCADVGTQSERIHSLQWYHSDAGQRSQRRSEHGRRLHQNSETASDRDRHVPD